MSPLVHELLRAAARPGLPVPLPYFFFLVGGPLLFLPVVMSRLTGHKALLDRYPPVEEPVEASFHFASGSLRWVDFNSALYVGIGTQGLHLAPNWFARSPFLRGIPCIPWSELRCVRPQSGGLFGWSSSSLFEVPALDLRFKLKGQPGRALERRLGSVSLGRS